LPPQKKNSALAGSPIGQRQVSSLSSKSVRRWPIGMMFSIRSGSGSCSISNASASAVLPRIEVRDTRIMCERGLRTRGAEDDGDLARPDRPSRCTLPITALRVMPPSSPAIWLADSPSAQSFFSSSTRSSVQDMSRFPSYPPAPPGRIPRRSPALRPEPWHAHAFDTGNRPPRHLVLDGLTLQYG
jgi:hypothetical protein